MASENIKIGLWDVYNEKCKNGKIYIIKNTIDDDFMYIGSTYNELDVRFKQHQNKADGLGLFMFNYVRKFFFNDWSSFYIELLFDYPCNTIRELRNKETEITLKLNAYNSPSKVELNAYKRTHQKKEDDYIKTDCKRTQRKKLEQMDYDEDNNIKCPYCLKMIKFYSIDNHINSAYHNDIYP